ncbi:hypothetical protein DS884_06210 [Tenacibaculum sp. E3R01]|uniref:DinB family protein n=1 Tax=Tenacibaculum sp. E3R01 TaxID=2267227 RepID=UPI000DEBF3C6|nr:DUF664 domain-containing protein [Tenacibaculum sp. E3R01]RBW59329.1 hypothetical protein DS884_06210 [Tenacibaculum sp. E3R01]
MKKLFFIFFLFSISIFSQSKKEISRSWTSFTQSIDITSDSEIKFKLIGSIKVEPADKIAWAGLWARVDTKNSERGFFDNMQDRGVKDNNWKEYTIEGTLNKNSKSLNFGGLCINNGKFYFDNIKLFIEDENGEFKKVSILNSDFEKKVANQEIKSWRESTNKKKIRRIKEFKLSSSSDAVSGKRSLLIIGSGIKVPEYEYGKIGKKDAENPQIDNMISMLEDLKARVHRIVKNLPLEHVDHLHDPKANRIGALVMHLAAAEVYYQKYTFGKSVFEEKEPELWKAGMDLDEKGREILKGKPISYYLEIFDAVRKKTIEELRKRDDKWFKEVNPGKTLSNQWSWFHIMEHQSSHLGQILFLRKRLPPIKKEVKIKEQVKN